MSRAQLTSTVEQNSGGAVAPYVAGKNKIINGDFNINQRNFTSNTTNNTYNFDRWVQLNGGASGTSTITPQAFTPGAAPVAGYEAKQFVQCITASGASVDTYAIYQQNIEDVRTLAGQTATVSFWAKATSGTPKIAVELAQAFGTGGSPSSQVNTYAGQVTLSTSWARYSVTVAVPSISGKTIGTDANSSSLSVALWLSSGSNYNSRTGSLGLQNATFQLWGIQIESGPVATPFTTASGTVQGELALCQRYYWRMGGDSPYQFFASGIFTTTTNLRALFTNPVPMRSAPSSIDFSTYTNYWTSDGNYNYTPTGAFTIDRASSYVTDVNIPTSGATTPRAGQLFAQNSTSAYIGFSAEL